MDQNTRKTDMFVKTNRTKNHITYCINIILIEFTYKNPGGKKIKKQLLKSALMAVVGVGLLAGGAMATPVTVTYTADNVVNTMYLVTDAVTDDTNYASGANRADWHIADTTTPAIEMDLNKHNAVIFDVSNLGSYNSGNPAALLAQISFGSTTIVSNASWKWAISTENTSTAAFDDSAWNWQSVTTYGANDGIAPYTTWENNNSLAKIAGISSLAQWIWNG